MTKYERLRRDCDLATRAASMFLEFGADALAEEQERTAADCRTRIAALALGEAEEDSGDIGNKNILPVL